jgi:hypothetical protein
LNIEAKRTPTPVHKKWRRKMSANYLSACNHDKGPRYASTGRKIAHN